MNIKITKQKIWLSVAAIVFLLAFTYEPKPKEITVVDNVINEEMVIDNSELSNLITMRGGEITEDSDAAFIEEMEKAEPMVKKTDNPIRSNKPAKLDKPVDKVGKVSPKSDNTVDYFKCMIIETKRREGLEHLPYDDGGEITIGYGTHITEKEAKKIWKDAGLTEKQGRAFMKNTVKRKAWPKGISELTAREMMFEWFKRHKPDINKKLPHLNNNQTLAVMSLAYNCGWGAVQRSKLFNELKKNNTSESVVPIWIKVRNGRDKNGEPEYDLRPDGKTNHEYSREFEAHLFLSHVSNKHKSKMLVMHRDALEKTLKYYK